MAKLNEKPEYWDFDYQVVISGKELAAIEKVAVWALDNLPPWSVIGAADCILSFFHRTLANTDCTKREVVREWSEEVTDGRT